MSASVTLAAFAAHPGHGSTPPDSWAHYLTEPVHLVSLAAAVAVAIAVGLVLRAWWRARR